VGFVDIDKNKKLYNAAAILQGGKIKGVYHKRNLPNYGVFDEKRYFHPGQKNPMFLVKGMKVAVNICEDIWIDHGVFVEQCHKGAKLLINISSSPYDVGKLKEREELLKRRAKTLKVYICYVNLVGGQDELVFDGNSCIVDPKGQIVATGEAFEEDIIVTDIQKGTKGLNKKNNASLVQPLSKRLSQNESIYKALVLGTRDYVQKNGFQKVVIGLSGGIDSALVATIAVDAIGKENVIAVTMPSRYTSKGTKSDAGKLAKNLGIELKTIAIEEIFKSYLKTLSSSFTKTKPNITEENIQARIRGNILMALSNKFGWLVLTTGNKSEIAVGYCTLYGDMSGGFAVIKDVPKTKVFELAKLRNKQGKPVIPSSILKRAPTAELRSNQRDQDTLPPYELLDKLLMEYVEQHRSLKSMSKKADVDLIKRIISMVDLNEYKRRQSPPGVKITPRAFGKDWRLPITNKYKEY